jgi:dipeptidyl-peptidase-4
MPFSPSVSALALGAVLVIPRPASNPPAHRELTTADYDRAVKMLGVNLDSLVIGGRVTATWLPDDRFYYRNTTPTGSEWLLVDPAHHTQKALFDAAGVAQALARAGAGRFDVGRLPATRVQLSADGAQVTFEIKQKQWRCDVNGQACQADTASKPAASEVASPDGKRAAFIRNWNLWVRDVANGHETQLTTDGVENFGYATDNAGWVHSDRPILLWSPDSKKIATQQQDDRPVGDMYLVETRVGHPKLQAWKYPLPGDSVVSMISRVIIDVDAAKVIRLATPPDFHRAMLSDNLSMKDLIWSPDGSQLAYVSTSRDHKSATVHIADANTGTVRTLFEERSPTQFESIAGWRILWADNQIIWSSERSDWAELYAYDLKTGTLLHPITTGAGPVTGINHVDERGHSLLVEARGREASEDPYFRH